MFCSENPQHPVNQKLDEISEIHETKLSRATRCKDRTSGLASFWVASIWRLGEHLGEKSLHIYCYTLPSIVFPGHPLPTAVRGRILSYGALSLTHLSVFVFLCKYSQHLSLLYRKGGNWMEANETNILQYVWPWNHDSATPNVFIFECWTISVFKKKYFFSF